MTCIDLPLRTAVSPLMPYTRAPGTAKASPPFLHMPLEFKDLEGVGIAPDLVSLTSGETNSGPEEGASEVSMLMRNWGPYLYFPVSL